MEFTDMIVMYGGLIATYLDGLTKTDLMVLLGAFLLGRYFGDKKSTSAREVGKRIGAVPLNNLPRPVDDDK